MKKLSMLWTSVLCLFCLMLVYSVWLQDTLANEIIRLHIVANSDSQLDQSIKLSVRDEILAFTKSEASPPDIKVCEKIAKNYLISNDVPYSATAKFENTFVPKKKYKSITLPQGNYNCIKVILGDGLGENWWCIAYPPLCYTESMFGDLSEDGILELEKILDGEIMSVIKGGNDINFRFKIVDEIQRLIKHYT